MAGEDDDWSPAIGWRKAATHLALRAPVVMGLASLGAIGLFWCLAGTRGHVSVSARTVFSAGMVVGLLAGIILSRRLVDLTGLIGAPLIFAAYLALTAAHVAAWAIAKTWGVPSEMAMGVVLSSGLLSAIWTTRTILLDS